MGTNDARSQCADSPLSLGIVILRQVGILFFWFPSVCFSMTPDDKKDLRMPSLDRRAKRKIVVFPLFLFWQVGKEEGGGKEEEEEEEAGEKEE